MWKGMSIVSGILLLGAAGVGYMSSLDAKVEIKLEEDAIKWAKEAAEHKEAAETHLAEVKAARTKREDELALKTGEHAGLESKKKDTDAEDKAADEALEKAKAQLAELNNTLKGLGELPALVAELNGIKAKKAEVEAAISATQNSQVIALNDKATTQKRIDELKKKDLWQKTGTMDASFTSRIQSVDPNYGFIVIGAGDNRQVVENAKLDVVRDGQKICTLKVTKVNPGTSIGDVVPGTLAKGQAVASGDKVVVNPESTPKTGNASAPAAPAKTPPPAVPEDPFGTPTAPPTAPPSSTPPATPSEPATPDPFASPAAPAAPAAPDATTPAPGNLTPVEN